MGLAARRCHSSADTAFFWLDDQWRGTSKAGDVLWNRAGLLCWSSADSESTLVHEATDDRSVHHIDQSDLACRADDDWSGGDSDFKNNLQRRGVRGDQNRRKLARTRESSGRYECDGSDWTGVDPAIVSCRLRDCIPDGFKSVTKKRSLTALTAFFNTS